MENLRTGRRGPRSLLSTLVIAALVASGSALIGVAPASAALSPPALGTPTAGASITANPVFTWGGVSGASGYRFELSTSSSFDAPLVDERTVSTRFTPTAQLPNGALYWRVATVDAAGNVGSFASSRELLNTWSPPALVSPANGAVLSFPSQSAVFTWDPVAGAQSYTLQVSDSNTFGAGTTDYKTPNTTYALTEPATSGTSVWWRVRATSGAQAVSSWSTPRSFKYTWASTPTLQTPLDASTVVDTHFAWSPVAAAKSYQIQISPNGDWTNNVTKDVTTFATAYSPAVPLLNGSYFWRVRAFDAAGHAGTWSDVSSVTRQWNAAPTVVTPAPASPGNPTTVGSIAFEWTPTARAAFYDLEVSDGINVLHCFTNHTRWTPYNDRLDAATPPPNDLQPSGCELAGHDWKPGVTYRWRVRAWDRDQHDENPGKGYGVWSSNGDPEAFQFDPTTPTITSPGNGATVETPDLRWSHVPNADHYLVTVIDNNGVITDYATPTYATSYSPTMLDPTAGPFTWSVQAVDHDGLTSAVQERTFALSDPASPSGTIGLLSPASSLQLAADAGADLVSGHRRRQLHAPLLEDRRRRGHGIRCQHTVHLVHTHGAHPCEHGLHLAGAGLRHRRRLVELEPHADLQHRVPLDGAAVGRLPAPDPVHDRHVLHHVGHADAELEHGPQRHPIPGDARQRPQLHQQGLDLPDAVHRADPPGVTQGQPGRRGLLLVRATLHLQRVWARQPVLHPQQRRLVPEVLRPGVAEHTHQRRLAEHGGRRPRPDHLRLG